MITKTTVSISIDKELLQQIDSQRGLARRSAWVEFQLKRAIENLGDSNEIKN